MSRNIQQQEIQNPEQAYISSTNKKILVILCLITVLFIVSLLALSYGASSVGPVDAFNILTSPIRSTDAVAEVSNTEKIIVLQLRLPRVLLAVMAGFSLAGAGVVMQGILRNPLVSPYTLGLSSGAAFGAALAIVLQVGIFGSGLSSYHELFIPANAFVFAMLTMFFIYIISSMKGATSETLILAGVAIGYFFSALVSALKYISDSDELPELVYWLMGSIIGANWTNIIIIFIPMVISIVILLRYSWDLNVLGGGEEVAKSLGVDVKRMKIICLIFSSLIAAVAVAFTGIIGFVGLVGPHISRIIVGADYRFLLPTSCFMGALLLLSADTLARTMIAPSEIPVGIVTSLLGVPFFLYLLLKKRKVWWQ
ncbi:FecCD family ABC transporter permease [Natranaerobius thermophilus]|uniref:Transport system permease protein n=1 Tax=Natranaerobius thermophilus (strain ATCC BAA-1301 / DSM 18059 / JW/NM-WN-LF) TaxID=457570 RepID=B2A1X5_NATTJ|nr:iron ABC transporter permease [Natranaerobius thermophilus]ACB86172.1 transport system permease protein [Natranaerobius thermophilus JW/NM-WN-LF]